MNHFDPFLHTVVHILDYVEFSVIKGISNHYLLFTLYAHLLHLQVKPPELQLRVHWRLALAWGKGAHSNLQVKRLNGRMRKRRKQHLRVRNFRCQICDPPGAQVRFFDTVMPELGCIGDGYQQSYLRVFGVFGSSLGDHPFFS
jgi:hypothetical protein